MTDKALDKLINELKAASFNLGAAEGVYVDVVPNAVKKAKKDLKQYLNDNYIRKEL